MQDPTTQAAAAAQDQPEPTAGQAPPAEPGNVWLVPHPTHQWAEDVKALARQHRLQIVDPAVAGEAELAAVAAEVPELTKRGEGSAAEAAAADAAAPAGAAAAAGPAKAAAGGKKARQ